LIEGAEVKLFISWSGERSKALAIAFRDWLPLVLHYVEPWLSEADIEAGERWAQSVAKELGSSKFGVVCVTSENVEDDPKRVDFGDGPRHVGYAATSFCAG
jgi:hypothetical protein